MSMISAGRCCFAISNGASCSKIWIEFNWSLKDWFRSCSWGMPAHCSFNFSMCICSAKCLVSSANGKNLLGWFTTMLSKVCIDVFTYPLNTLVPNTSEMSSGLFLFQSCRFSLCVVPNSGDTCQRGVSLSEDLSSAGFGGYETVFNVDSSVTLSCWRAGVWGIEGAGRGDGAVSTRISLVWSPGIHLPVGGTVCINCWFNPCLFLFDLCSGT